MSQSKQAVRGVERGIGRAPKKAHGKDTKGMAAPGNGQSILPLLAGSQGSGPTRQNSSTSKQGAPAKRFKTSLAGQKHLIDREIKTYEITQAYLRGRDLIYDDSLALARFNAWAIENTSRIDPAEQRVCKRCGHVGFVLCLHSVSDDRLDDATTVMAADVVPAGQRHHGWSLKIRETISRAFVWPGFDTHSPDDDRLGGMTNDHLKDLVIVELFAYICLHQQTSYKVNGRDDRDLRLAHSHRLAERWLVTSGNERLAESDLHYSVRVRHTVQRAADNEQNNMLYARRNPIWNFGLAWLPSSFGALVLFLALLAIVIFVAYSLLSSVATVLAVVWGANAQTSIPQHGNGRNFVCVVTSSYNRLVDDGDAYSSTQYCNFTDWVMAAVNEGLFQCWDLYIYLTTAFQMHRSRVCTEQLFASQMYAMFWASPAVVQEQYLRKAGLTDMLRLVGWQQVNSCLVYLYRC
jgi:hypothetical protein